MPRVELTVAGITNGILESGGLRDTNLRQLDENLRSSKPNTDNLTVTITGFAESARERLLASDGMPLEGDQIDSYDQAPQEYGRVFEPYPRSDSSSRVEGSEMGAKINIGASKHLRAMYPLTLSLLGSLVVGKHGALAKAGEAKRDLTANEALEVLNGCVSMWSLLSYRKQDRLGKAMLPPEVGLLHRSMSGVRMSLLQLFIRDIGHEYGKTNGWESVPFSAANWAQAVEESYLLVGGVKTSRRENADLSEEVLPRQLCVAPARMIDQVLHTIVDYPDKQIPTINLETTYKTTADTVLAYGRAYFDLEQARARKLHNATKVSRAIIDKLMRTPPRNNIDIEAESIKFRPLVRQVARQGTEEIADAFSKALVTLGYNPQTFRQAPPSF